MQFWTQIKRWLANFGAQGRALKRYRRQVSKINALESTLQAMSDADLRGQTAKFRARLEQGETLDSLLVEAFATVREVSRRLLQMRHFDVQLVGGMALHEGCIAEMKTGEGKTLAATLPAYLNALSGNGVHMITVNAYLAKRDMEWMKPIYDFLHIDAAVVYSEMTMTARKVAYEADITYGTHTEFAFDYLRDHLALEDDGQVQKTLAFTIIDEADSVLIDSARTPVVISGQAEQDAHFYTAVTQVVKKLVVVSTEDEGAEGDVSLDEKDKAAHLTEQGQQTLEELLRQYKLLEADASLYDPQHINLMFYVNAALRALHFYRKDVDYLVQDREVVIIDEHTGRAMPGRRWGEGLHQALEAKEKLPVQQESVTLATVTLQNYFRMYTKLAGMTGTATTEATELREIYGLSVLEIPTHKTMCRADLSDRVYMTDREKYEAIVEDIKERHEKGQPILVGTASLESSERLSKLLKKAGIKHNVLNAKQHAKEAKVIAQAGCFGAVTIATNMAGRGTDIVLGGHHDFTEDQIEGSDADGRWQAEHDRVVVAGGLFVLGVERNESRRVDNQLRGRSGRQGDPGESRYYLSLEDSLMRIFAPAGMMNVMKKLGMQEGETLEAPMLTRAIQSAQRKVEGHYCDIRKQLLKFDNVINEQRTMLYDQRDKILTLESMAEALEPFCRAVIGQLVAQHADVELMQSDWDLSALQANLAQDLMLDVDVHAALVEQRVSPEDFVDSCVTQWLANLQMHSQHVPAEVRSQIEKRLFLQLMDQSWREHLSSLEHLRRGIHLRGYAQKDPIQEYQREAYAMFTGMLDEIKSQYVRVLSRLRINEGSEPSSSGSEGPKVKPRKKEVLGSGASKLMSGSVGWGQETTLTTD